MPCRWVRVALAGLVFGVWWAVPSAPAAAERQSEPCAAGLTDEWKIIHDDPTNPENDPSSRAPGQTIVCNFSVTRKVPLDDGGTSDYVSGVAITIEYYCSAAEGQDAFEGKTSPRDTETERTSTRVVSEEGPAALTDSNGPVYSNFLERNFELFEKSWVLLNSQTVATIVVLTDERGAVDETERFGVGPAEVIARQVANTHRLQQADCQVPPIDAGVAPRGGKSRTGVIIAVTGGSVVVITGGTVLRRKLKKPRGARPGPLADVPPQCAGHARAFEESRNRYLDLKHAFDDLSEQLRRAEVIHANNIMKIKILGAWELASIAGGALGDAAGAATRPRGTTPMTKDNWSPPGTLSSKLRTAIESAREALTEALSKVSKLSVEIEPLRQLRRSIHENPAVIAAKQFMDDMAERARGARTMWQKGDQAFTEMEATRKLIDSTEPGRQQLLRLRDAARAELDVLSDQLSKAGTSMNANVSRLQADIKRIRGEIASLYPTVDAANPARPRLDPDALRRREMLEDRLASYQDDLTQVQIDEGSRIRAIEERLNTAKGNIMAYDASWEEAKKALDRMMKQYEHHAEEFRRFGNLTKDQVEQLERQAMEATTAYDKTHGSFASKIDAELLPLQRQIDAAQKEAAHARRRLERLEALGQKGISEPPGQPWSWNPVKLIGRGITWAIGNDQSPEEMWQILQAGKQNIDELTTMVNAIAKEMDAELEAARVLREALAQCMDRAKAPLAAPALPEKVPV